MSRVRTVLQSHWIIMAVCCLVPMVALVAIVGFDVPVTTAALVGLALICPLSHIVMMRSMTKQDHHDH